MIKHIFIPEKIGSYYIFPKRIIGFDLGKTVVHAYQVYLHGNSITIERSFEERIAPGENINYPERVGQAIKTILDSIGRFNSIYSAIDSSRIVFKKLTLPFVQYDKIKKVIYFEAEPLLPFPIHEAVVDFVIANQNVQEGKAEVLIAAVQNEQIEQHLELFAQAGVSPEVVTVDLFSLYGLYRRIPTYAQLEGDVALIDLGMSETRIAYIHDRHLSFIRTLPKGISTIAKVVGDQTKHSAPDVLTHIMRFGFEQEDDKTYREALTKAFTVFWNEIGFTLRSFSMRTDQLTITKLLLLGIGSEIKGISSFVHQLLTVSCESFVITELFNDKNITLKQNQRISSSAIISLSVALPSPITEQFNLLQEQQKAKYATVINKQIVIVIGLVVVLFSLFIIHSIMQTRKLRLETVAAEKEAVRALKTHMPKLEEESNRLSDLVDTAQEVVAEEEKRTALMSPARISYLNYLLELIARIDKKALGFEIERVSFLDGVMTLKSKVKDYNALRKFEASLRESKLFSYTESQEKPEFEAKIDLVQNAEEL